MHESQEKLEIELLFEAMFRRYGYDFRNYAFDSARRRVLEHVKKNRFENIAALQHAVIEDEHQADALLINLSINVTEMFRDPAFFLALREKVLPQFDCGEHLKIWHAGCSSGEEAYSMAILLKELGMLNQTQLYATDFNTEILERAREGILKLKAMRQHIQNYQRSGGLLEFGEYYHAKHDYAKIHENIKKPIVFSHHNLAGDGVFGEMQVIVCRNVLIYFNRQLQERVLQLFDQSLAEGGYLCLGSHESLKLSSISRQYHSISMEQRIYQKKAI